MGFLNLSRTYFLTWVVDATYQNLERPVVEVSAFFAATSVASIEPHHPGPYDGAVGYIDCRGKLANHGHQRR